MHSQGVVLDIDFISNLKEYLDQLYINPEDVNNLQQLIAYTINDPREDYPDRNVETWQVALARNLTQQSEGYLQALANDTYLGTTGTIVGAMDKYDLDALILPTDIASGVAAIAGEL
jgi:amidase